MRKSRRLRVLLLALLLGALAAGGSTYLPTREHNARLAKPAGILPGYGAPVSEQSSGRIAPTPLNEDVVDEPNGGPVEGANELEAASRPTRIQGQFIVNLAPGQNPREAAAAISREFGGEAKLVYENATSGFLFVGPDDARERLTTDPRVQSVEPDYVMYLAESSASVHLAAINQPAAVNAGYRGSGVRIAILDTGALATHTAFANNVETSLSTGFTATTDSQGNLLSCTKGGQSYGDSNGHGSRTVSNAVGSLGVAPDARAVIVKVFPGSSGETSFALIQCGIDYVVGLNSDGTTANDVAVVNASIAGSAPAGDCSSPALHKSVCALVNGKTGTTKRAVFFAAAGNSGASASGYSPGNYPEAIDVSGFDCSAINCTTTKPALASWSNRGSTVDLGAPGASIYSASKSGGYETASGTSRASPQAAGAAADILSAFPSWGPAEIRSALLKGGKCPDMKVNGVVGNCVNRGTWTNDDSVTEPFLNVGWAITGAPPPADNPPTVSFNSPTNGATVASSFTVSVRAQDDLDTPTATLKVDGGAAASMSCGTGLSVTCTRSVGPLSTGTHTLTAQSFDAHSHSSAPLTISVTVSSSPPPPPPPPPAPVWQPRVQENGGGVTYSSGWTSASASCTSGGTYRYSGTSGATATYSFTGVGVRFVTAVGPNLGRAQIYVDNVLITTVDTYATSQACNLIKFERTGLSSGSHTLRVQVTTKNASSSGSSVVVDAFQRLA